MTDGARKDLSIEAEELAALFHRVTRLMARAFHRRDNAHHAQARVLELLLQRGPISQAELLEILDVRASSLSELLAKLERGGRIRRTRNEQDRRSFIIEAVDDAGQGAAMGDRGREVSEALFAPLDQQERAQLRGLLLKLMAPLADEAPLRGGLFGGPHGGCRRGGGRQECGRHGGWPNGGGQHGGAGRGGFGRGGRGESDE
jgi:DNA-binding MarR family transcriptional regulator